MQPSSSEFADLLRRWNDGDAEALEVSLATVKRDLQYARAWLAAHLADGALSL